MTDAMDAEFDTVARWTAAVALDLGPEYHIVAGCRGSGSPAVLDWLIDNLQPMQGESLLDCGAGMGGPAAYLMRRTQVRPVLVDPMPGACRAGSRLFDLPVARADAHALPFGDGRFAAAWCLGVLCTTDRQEKILHELRRVVARDGRVALLVFAADHDGIAAQPLGNQFPTDDELRRMITATGLQITAQAAVSDLPQAPRDWQRREAEIDAELDRRHRGRDAWLAAEEQQQRMSALIGNGEVFGRLLVASA